MIYRNLNNYSISYYAEYFKINLEAAKMERELTEYSNAPDVDVSKIPKAVITDIANIIYAAMCRDAAAEQNNQTRMAREA